MLPISQYHNWSLQATRPKCFRACCATFWFFNILCLTWRQEPEPSLESQDEDDGRGRPRGHYHWELHAFVSQKKKLTLRFPATSFKPWLTSCQTHPYVCSTFDERNAVWSVVMTTLTVNDFAFKNVAMQLCNFPNQYLKSTYFSFYDYFVVSESHT